MTTLVVVSAKKTKSKLRSTSPDGSEEEEEERKKRYDGRIMKANKLPSPMKHNEAEDGAEDGQSRSRYR